MRDRIGVIGRAVLILSFSILFRGFASAGSVKEPDVAGRFYPADRDELRRMIASFLDSATPGQVEGPVIGILSPHAGYEFSGPTAAFAYKLIKGKRYKTVVVIASNHRYPLRGISVYPDGVFRTPLGDIPVDKEFSGALIANVPGVVSNLRAFEQEHSLEVQLPFLQTVLEDWKLVPVMMGDASFEQCSMLSQQLAALIGKRDDVLLVASSDMYHGYDYDEARAADKASLEIVSGMDAAAVYNGVRSGNVQMCGGLPLTVVIGTARRLGHEKFYLLSRTDSAAVTGNEVKGVWTVGYASAVIDSPKGGDEMLLNKEQRKKMLETVRSVIETYLKTGQKPDIKETDPVLTKTMGAFVTLHKKGELRGCIGNIVGTQPLYLTIRDMAIESSTGDPRFPKVTLDELKDIDIEISVLSPLEKVKSAEDIVLGKHGVLVRRGLNSGVFLPQVADETGWSRDEFLSYLCAHKAGLPSDAWKDKKTELFVFTAEVFSEKEY